MTNGRNPGRKKVDQGRDSGAFVALPWSVLDCPAYSRLSVHARVLLLEVARQILTKTPNNGRLLLSREYMKTRGWNSSDMLTKSKRALLDAGFIFETVRGQLPNKASWYAVTWRALDKIPGYDTGAVETFKRGAYQQNMSLKNAPSRPSHGTRRPQIVPPHGTGQSPVVPPHGPIGSVFGGLSVPSHGHHLEEPSTANESDYGTYRRLIASPANLFTSLIH